MKRGTFRMGSNSYFRAGQAACRTIAKAAAERRKAEAALTEEARRAHTVQECTELLAKIKQNG